ncbi:unnamed protein product [Rotaria sp. Silwood1]|nr:unnamed protein product [Rotaria sp. Silwood1]
MVRRKLREALHYHVIVLLLFINFIVQLTNIPWILNFYRIGKVWPQNSFFCLVWIFIDEALYITITILFAWATIERHILIFHDQLLSTKYIFILIHYLPIAIILLYSICYNTFAIFVPQFQTIERIFLANKFEIKEAIDFQSIYLEKYYDKFRLKKVTFYENLQFKYVFNYFDKLSTEYKTKLNTLVLANVVKGTFDCSHNTEQIVEKTEKKTCENTKYKIILIDSLITSSSYCDEYLSTVKQIEGKVHEYFKQFNIIHIKIKTLASNEGVPQTNID